MIWIDDVTSALVERSRLAGFDLGSPVQGQSSDTYSMGISGWARGRSQEVTRFEIVHGTKLIEAVPPLSTDSGTARFQTAISSLDLAYQFQFVVRALLADGSRARMAVVRGSRQALPSAPFPGPVPVLVTTIGRSGSTMVCSLLAQHPDCVGYRTWDFESRMVSYWIAVMRALTRPASYERQFVRPLPVGSPQWWTGDPAHVRLRLDEPGIGVFGREGVEGVARFCRDQIGHLGTSLAAAAGKPGARRLVEKTQPGTRTVAEMAQELDPATRELVLVRDFRDTVCSMRAYSNKTGASDFAPAADVSLGDAIRWVGQTAAKLLSEYVERRRGAAHVLRYEDLILRPEQTLTDVLDFVGLESSSEIVARMCRQLGAYQDERRGHATTPSPDESVGRWRRELGADEQVIAEEVLRPYLNAFGYD
jgi:hypothetical protein